MEDLHTHSFELFDGPEKVSINPQGVAACYERTPGSMKIILLGGQEFIVKVVSFEHGCQCLNFRS